MVLRDARSIFSSRHIRRWGRRGRQCLQWIEWIAATGYIKMVGIRWALSEKGLEAVGELKGMDVEEILEDLVKGATAGTYYWSRSPGMFLDRTAGTEVGASSAAPDFTGTVSEWYETLVETINDVSAQIHRKTLRGGANFLVTSPEVANILEFTSGFRANITHDDDKGTVGTVKVGNLSKKWDVYVDPYFPRNVVLVGRKGGSFLESGYVFQHSDLESCLRQCLGKQRLG